MLSSFGGRAGRGISRTPIVTAGWYTNVEVYRQCPLVADENCFTQFADAMTKLALFPLAAGIICLIVAIILIAKIGGPLDVQIHDHYFVLSPKWLFLAGMVLVVPSLALAAAH
jgi:hypothetical protein